MGVSDMESEHKNEPIHEQLLSDAAAQLRMALGSMSSVLSRIVPPEARDADPRLDAHAALLYQSYYKMLRIVNNMTAAAELTGERPCLCATTTWSPCAGRCASVQRDWPGCRGLPCALRATNQSTSSPSTPRGWSACC